MRNHYITILLFIGVFVAEPILGQQKAFFIASQNLSAMVKHNAISVSGMVTSGDDNQPMPGVNILVKGTSIGTSTDANGKYTINTPNENDVLIFSFLGFTTQEIPVNGKSTIDVSMAASTGQLSEIVVIGYGTSNKKDVTGAITAISSEEFNLGVFTSPAQVLQGKVAGLNITKSG